MPHAEKVIRALAHAREPRQAVLLAQGIKGPVASGEDLVGVALMPHVPDQLVPRKIKGGKQGQRQFHCAQ